MTPHPSLLAVAARLGVPFDVLADLLAVDVLRALARMLDEAVTC